MSDLVMVAVIGGSFGLLTVAVQVFGVRINTKQHGDSVDRLERIEQAQMTVAKELLEHREGSLEYRQLQTSRHEQNVNRLNLIDAHVKAVDGRVQHLEGDQS